MTEEEWLTNRDAAQIPAPLQNQFSDRTRRLFVVAACRIEKLVELDPRVVPVLDAAERFADDDDTMILAELFRANLRYDEAQVEFIRARRYDDLQWLRMATCLTDIPIRLQPLSGKGWLLRDIFGNPFRPVAFDPAWRSEAAVGIARGIYDDRAFERMPILADALQEAGCEHSDILAHCREPGVHVRGCWVVDLVLGKE